MLLEKDVKQMLNQLASGDSINVPFDDSTIMIRVIDHETKLSLATLIYEGDQYIPHSVRRCISHRSPFLHPSIRSFLTIDEQRFQVKLNYLGQAQPLSSSHFKEILEEFGMIAEKWRHYLDDHDKNDLIHVRVK